jgi:Flp pilus assembly protein CpaB
MTPATLLEGERALKVRVEAVLAASGFIILPPGKK